MICNDEGKALIDTGERRGALKKHDRGASSWAAAWALLRTRPTIAAGKGFVPTTSRSWREIPKPGLVEKRYQDLFWGLRRRCQLWQDLGSKASSPSPGPEDRSPNQVSLRKGSKTCFDDLIGGANFDKGFVQRLHPQNPGPEDRFPNHFSLRRGPNTCFEDL